jgi:hypothetical protein
MVAQKFGRADPDIRKGSKETRDKEMERPGRKTPYSGMVGGESNRPGPAPDAGKTGPRMSFKDGGKVPSATSIPAYVPGGFRNKAMEHKR